MSETERAACVEAFIAAYNAYDLDSMLACVHPEIVFSHIANGETVVRTEGLDELRELAEHAAKTFASRRQTVTQMTFPDPDTVATQIVYEAVAAVDLSPELPAGSAIRLEGRSEYAFKDGKIVRLADYS